MRKGVCQRMCQVGDHVQPAAQRLEGVDEMDRGGSGRERAHDQQVHRVDLKYAMVFRSPSSSWTQGDHPSEDLASSMSGLRWRGSSWGRGLKARRDLLSVRARTFSASSRMVNSTGLPRLTG